MKKKAEDEMKLANKRALVTGAGRGIGCAIALMLASEGADVAVCFHSDAQSAEDTASKIKDMGNTAFTVRADVANPTAVNQMISSVYHVFDGIDILINNAGSILWKNLAKSSFKDWQHIIDTNLTGVFNCTSRVLPQMIKRGFGRIINIASVFAFHGHAGTVAYSTSKAALIGFTRTLAKEVGPRGIRVNGIAPGFISTDMTKKVLEGERNNIISNIPLGRAGSPEDIARVAVFLASDEASYITGQIIIVDGGWKL